MTDEEKFQSLKAYLENLGSEDPSLDLSEYQSSDMNTIGSLVMQRLTALKVMESAIFQNGQVKKDPRRNKKTLPITDLERFIHELTHVFSSAKSDPESEIAASRRYLREEIEIHFSEIFKKYDELEKKLKEEAIPNYNKTDKVRNALEDLEKTVLEKIKFHDFPVKRKVIGLWKRHMSPQAQLGKIFKKFVPGLSDEAIGYRITEILNEFGLPVNPSSIARKRFRQKKSRRKPSQD